MVQENGQMHTIGFEVELELCFSMKTDGKDESKLSKDGYVWEMLTEARCGRRYTFNRRVMISNLQQS